LIHFYKRVVIIMRETPVSSCESQFLLEALWEGKRLEGRGVNDVRDIDIVFGTEWGSVLVTQGTTRVLAQVSAQVTEPRLARPNEGILIVNVELSPLAAPRFEPGRLSDEGVEINRTLERCLKESRCLDLESLCIISEEKVWTVRLDLHIINHEGNMGDVCSVAGLSALCHFRRPDVSLKGDVVTVHPITERDPVPLAIHHHPVTTTFAMFQLPGGSDTVTVVDPSRLEEEVMLGKMVLGVNVYREICTLHLAGQVIIDKGLVLRLAHMAAEKSKKVVEQIKHCLAKEEELRKSGGGRGFSAALRTQSILSNSAEKKQFDFSLLGPGVKDIMYEVERVSDKGPPVKIRRDEKEDFVEMIPDTMETVDDSEDEDEESKASIDSKEASETMTIDDDSEEEETVTLTKI